MYPNPVFKFILDYWNFAPCCLHSVPLWNVQIAYKFITSSVVGAVWLSVACLENLETPSNFSCTTVGDKPVVVLGGLQAANNVSDDEE